MKIKACISLILCCLLLLVSLQAGAQQGPPEEQPPEAVKHKFLDVKPDVVEKPGEKGALIPAQGGLEPRPPVEKQQPPEPRPPKKAKKAMPLEKQQPPEPKPPAK